MRKDPLMQLLAAALRPKEQDHAHRAAAGGQAAEHRDDGQQVLIRSGGDETGQIDRQRKTEKDRCFGDLPLPLVLQISVLTLFRLLFFHVILFLHSLFPAAAGSSYIPVSGRGALTFQPADGRRCARRFPPLRPGGRGAGTAAFVSVPYSDVSVKKSFAAHVRLKNEKLDFQPYKNSFFTDLIPENTVLNRIFRDVIRLKTQKICFYPYRITRKYGYR